MSDHDENGGMSPGWRVTSIESADWALERIGQLEREQAENDAVYGAALCRIKDRHEKLQERLQASVDFFTACLRMYAEEHRAELLTGKRKSRALLHGQIGWRRVGGGLRVVDEAAFLAWAKARGKVRVTESPDRAAIKLDFEMTGEIPDGSEPEPEREEFSVKTTKENA